MEIAIYTFCVMYSPGPVNILALNEALQGGRNHIVGYCVGVGLAMFTGFLLLGYVGAAIVSDWFLSGVAIIGSAYILYLAYELWTAHPDLETDVWQEKPLRLRTGFFLQLFNPKGFVLILPVTTIMFPATGIGGIWIVACAALISLGAIAAPGVYAIGGALLGRRFAQSIAFHWFNRAMALMLVFVACSIIYDFFIAASLGGGHS